MSSVGNPLVLLCRVYKDKSTADSAEVFFIYFEADLILRWKNVQCRENYSLS